MFLRTRNADAQVVAAVLSGDRNAFAALVGRYERVVQGMALSYGSGNVFTEDVAQETFLRAFKDLGRLRDAGRFGPWLMQIARCVAIDYARKNARQQPLTDEAGEAFEQDPGATELHRMLREEVSRLAPAFREIIVLHYFSGKSTREIADLLGLSKAAAQKRLQRARVDLGANLEKHLPGAFVERRPSAATVASIMAVVATAALPARAQGAVVVSAGALGSGLLLKGLSLAMLMLVSSVLAWLYFGPGSVPQSPPAVGVGKMPKAVATPVPVVADSPDPTPESAAATARTAPEETEAAISGTISDAQGKPVAGAKVIGYAAGGFRAEAESNTEGRYKLEWLAVAPYTLRVRAKGYWPGKLEEVRVGSTNADFRLDQAPLIAGRVLRADTKGPIAGARLNREGAEAIVTNEQGAFEFEVESAEYVRAAEEVFTVTADGYLQQVAAIARYLQVEAGQQHEILLEPMPMIEGMVVTVEGSPVPNAEIHAEQVQKNIEDISADHRPAQPDGAFRVGPSTRSRLQPGWRPDPPSSGPVDEVVARSDAKGEFRITSLKSWPESLYATQPGLAPAAAALGDQSQASPIHAKIIMAAGGTIVGQVRINGEPLTHEGTSREGWLPSMYVVPTFYQVSAQLEENPAIAQLSTGEAAGRFTIENVPPGAVRARLRYHQLKRESYSYAQSPFVKDYDVERIVQVRSGEVTTVGFDLRVTMLYGKVRFENGLPAQSGSLNYTIEPEGARVMGSTSIIAETDGGYSMFLPAGATVELTAEVRGPNDLVITRDVQTLSISTEVSQQQDIVLPRGATIAISLRNCPADARDGFYAKIQYPEHAIIRGSVGVMLLRSDSITHLGPLTQGTYGITLMRAEPKPDSTEAVLETILKERSIEVTDAGEEYAVEFDMSQISLDPPALAQ